MPSVKNTKWNQVSTTLTQNSMIWFFKIYQYKIIVKNCISAKSAQQHQIDKMTTFSVANCWVILVVACVTLRRVCCGSRCQNRTIQSLRQQYATYVADAWQDESFQYPYAPGSVLHDRHHDVINVTDMELMQSEEYKRCYTHRGETSLHDDVMSRQQELCSWHYDMIKSDSLWPRVLYSVACSGRHGCKCGRIGGRCQPNYIYRRVLHRTGECDERTGYDVWAQKWVKLAIACSCKIPLTIGPMR